jgi:Flp pilus assembly protein TadB
MSYRDDLDAALARADALEHENTELRAKAAALEARGAHDEQARADLRRHDLLERAKLREQSEQARRDAARLALEAELASRGDLRDVPPAGRARRDPVEAETSAATTARAVALTIACILAGILLAIGGLVTNELGVAAVAFVLIVLLSLAIAVRRE